MNRLLIIVIVVVGALAVIAGFVYLSRPTAPATSTTPIEQGNTTPVDNSYTVEPQAQTKEAARATFQQALDKHNIDNTKLYETSISGGYALQVWRGNIMGGEALLRYDSVKEQWTIVDSSGGIWSVEALVARGVATSTAEALLVGMPH